MQILHKLRLGHRVLILVGAMLWCELVFSGILLWLQCETERVAKREEFGKMVVGRTNLCFQKLYEAGFAADKFLRTRGPVPGKDVYDKYLENVRIFDSEMADLQKQVEDPKTAQTIEKVRHEAAEGFGVLREFMQYSLEHGRDYAKMKYATQLLSIEHLKSGVVDTLHEMLDSQHQVIEESAQERLRFASHVKTVVVAGIALNAVLAIGVAMILIKSLTSRLEMLVDNTMRLARGLPLHPTLPGTDEISHLDKTFHDMADALAEAARKKKEIVAVVSHDLRTPLTSLQGYLSLLYRGAYGDLTDTALERTRMAERAVARLIKLINDLLDLEKLESGKFDFNPVDAHSDEIIEASLNSLRGIAEERKIQFVEPEFDITCHCDPERIEQVLINLLSNALKYSPDNSKVSIGVVREKGFVRWIIRDQGPGIPPDLQEAIFERFQQVSASEDRKKGGTGLGLAICKAIIEQHGGTIGVMSEIGQGSAFWFTVPSSNAMAVERKAEEALASEGI